jgi:hypothetical protein
MIHRLLFPTILTLLMTCVVMAQVTTRGNRDGSQRTAANLTETTLTVANVNVTGFGKLYSYRVDAPVSRQPLYAAEETIDGARHNVLYVATATGTLYAFDVDSSSPTPLRITRLEPGIPVDAEVATSGGGPVWWESPGDGPLGYTWSENDVLKAYRLNAGRPMTPAVMHGGVLSPRESGATLALSANRSATGTGIVWASMPAGDVSLQGEARGILRAFDAETLKEIWTSEQNPVRDRAGAFPHSVAPVVANGKVYMANSDGSIAVYGLLPATTTNSIVDWAGAPRATPGGIQAATITAAAADFTVTATPASRSVTPGGSTTYTAAIAALDGFSGTVGLTVSGAPTGTHAAFTPASLTGFGSATLRITTSSFTPSGSWRLTIKATSGLLSHTATVTLVVGAQSAIGIKFLGSNPLAMAAGDSAGVVRQTHWNNAAGARSTRPLALVDSSGTLRTATVTWTASGVWMTPIVDQPGNARLMKGYLDNSNTTLTTVSVAGLPSGGYDVYVYTDGDNKAYNRTASYQISGTGITTTTINVTDLPNMNFAGTFAQATGAGGNYVKFRINSNGFTVTAKPGTSTNANVRAPVNAIQIVSTSVPPPVSLGAPATVPGLGAGQGVEVRDGKVYLYGDASTGVVREYNLGTTSLAYTGRQILLTTGGRDLVSHPTGLTVSSGIGTFLGNTVSQQGTIFMIDWARALATGTLDGAIQATITDDLAVNGTRPEFVRVGQRWLIATADYGATANELRIYDPEKLKTVARTSEPGVLLYRFKSSPYVQTLHWLDAQGLLVLVQNQRDGQGWRLTVIDLARSIAAGQQVVMQTISLSPQDELEGFHLVAPGRGLFLTSSSSSNLYFANVRLF